MNENQVLIKRMSSLKVVLCYSHFNEQKITLFAGYGEQKISSYNYGGIKKLKIWYGITKSMKNFTVL